MASVTIPLAGVHNTRGQYQLEPSVNGLDQRFINCDFSLVKNPITGDAKLYLQKRWGLSSHIATGNVQRANPSLLVSVTGDIISAFGTTAANVYVNSTSVGSNTGVSVHITEALINGKNYYFFTHSNGFGSYLVSDSYAQTAYTGNRTSGSPIITGIASTAGMYPGQSITGDSGIPGSTRILSVDSATQITLTNNATSGAATSTALTKTPLARFISTNFPAEIIGKFIFLDGYLFIMDKTNKRIYQSALNDINSWNASHYITVRSTGEEVIGIARSGSYIVAFCSASTEFFVNAGNPSGSVLSSQKELFRRIGVNNINNLGALSIYPAYSYSGDSVFFIGNEGGQSRGVYVLTGTEIRKISTPEVDRPINRSGGHVLSCFSDKGRTYVSVFAVTHDIHFLGCLETGMWSEFDAIFDGLASDFVYFCGGLVEDGFTADATMVFAVVNQPDQEGIVFRLRSDIYQDSGDPAPFTMSCQTSKTDFGTENLKTIKNVALMGSDIQSSGTATLEYSDNDYTTWTTAGTFDLTTINPKIHRVGSFRGGRAWRLTHSANTAFRAQALKFEYEVGQH
jgi:hypothetical protein